MFEQKKRGRGGGSVDFVKEESGGERGHATRKVYGYSTCVTRHRQVAPAHSARPLPSPLLIRTSSLLALLPSPFPLIKPNNGLPLLLNSFNPISRPQYFPPLSQVTRALILHLHLHHQSLSLNYPPPLCVLSQSCSLFFQC